MFACYVTLILLSYEITKYKFILHITCKYMLNGFNKSNVEDSCPAQSLFNSFTNLSFVFMIQFKSFLTLILYNICYSKQEYIYSYIDT